MKRHVFLPASLATMAAGLTPVSVYVVVRHSAEEPYGVFNIGDARLNLIVATALMTLWGVWTGCVIAAVGLRALSWPWLLAALWGGVCIFYLSFCPRGYL